VATCLALREGFTHLIQVLLASTTGDKSMAESKACPQIGAFSTIVTRPVVLDINPQRGCHKLFWIANNGRVTIMGSKKSRIDGVAASTRFATLLQICLMPARRFRRPGNGLPPVWPPDSLTRLLMEADGVTEAGLGGLLQRVAAARMGD
jgi:hypothetical protein